MSTLASDGATRSISWSTGRISADSAMSSARPSRRSSRFSLSSRCSCAERAAQLDLGAQGREQARVVPRLLDEVARAAAHRLDRLVDAAPRRHDDHGQRRRRAPGAREQQVEPLAPGGGVARVVEVHEHGVEVLRARRAASTAAGEPAVSISYPSPLSSRRSASRTSGWSSATRMCGGERGVRQVTWTVGSGGNLTSTPGPPRRLADRHPLAARGGALRCST